MFEKLKPFQRMMLKCPSLYRCGGGRILRNSQPSPNHLPLAQAWGCGLAFTGRGLGGFSTLRGFQPISDDTAGSAEGCPWGIPRVGLVCVAQGSVRLRGLLSIQSNQKNLSARGDILDKSCRISYPWSPSWGWPLEGTAATPTSPDCSPLREPPLLPTYLPQTSPPLG